MTNLTLGAIENRSPSQHAVQSEKLHTIMYMYVGNATKRKWFLKMRIGCESRWVYTNTLLSHLLPLTFCFYWNSWTWHLERWKGNWKCPCNYYMPTHFAGSRRTYIQQSCMRQSIKSWRQQSTMTNVPNVVSLGDYFLVLQNTYMYKLV